MDDAVENARMREFIEAQGLSAQYKAFLKRHDAEHELLSKPEVYVSYQNVFGRGARDEIANVTPWLRQASHDEMIHLAGILRKDAEHRAWRSLLRGTDESETPPEPPKVDDEDRSFLADVVSGSVDEEAQNWIYKARETAVYINDLPERLRKAIEEVRPDDHEGILDAMGSDE